MLASPFSFTQLIELRVVALPFARHCAGTKHTLEQYKISFNEWPSGVARGVLHDIRGAHSKDYLSCVRS